MKRFLLVFSGLFIVIGLTVALALLLPPRQDIYDFVMLYTADLGILNHVPIYNTPALEALTLAKTAADPGNFSLYPYPYPPWYALSTFYLGWLPPNRAANAWLLLNIAMLITAILLLTDGWKPLARILALLAGLLFIPALGLVIVGQYSIPVLLGAALFYYAARRAEAPLAALGLLLMTFKPHIGGILVAAGLLWLLWRALPTDSKVSRLWNIENYKLQNREILESGTARRAVWLTLGGGLGLAALGFLADPAWPLTYFHSVFSYSTLPEVANSDLLASFPAAIVKLLLGHPSDIWSYTLSAVLLIAMAILFWQKGIFADPAALVANVAVMTLIGDPYMLNYDYVLLLIPLSYLVTRRKSWFERAILAVIYLAPWGALLSRSGGNLLLNLGALATLGLLVFGQEGQKAR